MHNTVMSEFNAATYLLTGSGSNIPRNNDDISTKIIFLRRMGGMIPLESMIYVMVSILLPVRTLSMNHSA